MVKKERLSIDLKRDKKGFAYVEAQKCGECGHVQKAGNIEQMNKDTFLVVSSCEKCHSSIVTACGDRHLIENFISEVQLGIHPKHK